MTKQNADRFLKIVSEDSKLRKIAFDLYQKKRRESLEQLAAQKGCVCSYEQITTAFKNKKASQKELSEAELQAISAGGAKDKPPGPHSGVVT